MLFFFYDVLVMAAQEFVSPYRRKKTNTRYVDAIGLSDEDAMLVEFSRRADWKTGISFIHSTELQRQFGHDYCHPKRKLIANDKLVPENTTAIFYAPDERTGERMKGKCLTFKLTEYLFPTIELERITPSIVPDLRTYTEITREKDIEGRIHHDHANEVAVAVMHFIQVTEKSCMSWRNFPELFRWAVDGTFYDNIQKVLRDAGYSISKDAVKGAFYRICNSRFLSFGQKETFGHNCTMLRQSALDLEMQIVAKAIRVLCPSFYTRVRSYARRQDVLVMDGNGRYKHIPFPHWMMVRFEQTIRAEVKANLTPELADMVETYQKFDGSSVETMEQHVAVMEAYRIALTSLGISMTIRVKGRADLDVTYRNRDKNPLDIWMAPAYAADRSDRRARKRESEALFASSSAGNWH